MAPQTSTGETVVRFIEDAARKFGPRTALFFKPGFRSQRWTYAQLWEGAGQVASLLQQRGVVKGDRVILWGHNSPQWVLAFLGSMRAGAVVVPLDLRSSSDFVQRVAPKTRPKMAFVSRLTPEFHEELGLPEVRLEELEEQGEGLPAPEPVDVTPDDLAEVMFTSGTTGDPKGVMLTHGNLMANVQATSQHVPGKPSDRMLSILPLSHMFEQMGGLLIPLRIGANITYPTSRQPTVMFRTMQERKVTLLLLVPQGLDLFMKGIEREVRRQGKEGIWNLLLKVAKHTPFRLRRTLFKTVHEKFGGSLEFVVAGGAPLDPELGAKWELLGVRIIQAYGATEASPTISIHTMRRPRYDSTGPLIPGVEVNISDDGELLVRGPNVTPGYWEAPEQTATAFEDGWYKTGDQGYFDEDGFLHLKGRKKDMIVLANGQNVYPEDIEAILKKHPVIGDAVVVGLPKGSDTEVHAVFLTEQPAAAKEVVSWANSQLAEHQQVRGFTVWPEEDFPRTHTLKVKKGEVIETLKGSSTKAPAVVEADQKQQEASTPDLHRLLAEVGDLGPGEVTPDKTLGDDLNLDSLKRVELLSAIEGELGVYLDENEVGQETTVGELSKLVDQGSKDHTGLKFPAWGMSLWCRMLRGALQRAIIFPVTRMTYRLRVTGRENLHGLPGPVLFAANHSLPLDNGLIIKAIPPKWRRRLAIAGAAKLWRSPIWAIMNPLLGNGFPFSQEGAIRASLDNLGRIVDDGWSVLIYPEGKVTVGGPIQPFMAGTGLLAIEGRLSVVPMLLRIEGMGSPWRFPLLRRGDIEVRFGKPLSFAPRTDYEEATRQIEHAVKSL